MSKATPPKVIRPQDLVYKPRFEYGHMADMALMIGKEDGSQLATGWGHFKKAEIPWTITYDEIILVTEGELKVHCNGETLSAGPNESIWLCAGTELVYEAEDCRFFWAVAPSNPPKKN